MTFKIKDDDFEIKSAYLDAMADGIKYINYRKNNWRILWAILPTPI
jgi:hypothetical protein